MATESRKTGFPKFIADVQSAEGPRRHFIEAPMETAQPSALGAAAELANLMSILPDAFVNSQRRELERIKRSGNENDPRVAALQTSIEQVSVLQTMAQRGQTRVQRALVAIASHDNVFHGFVSDRDVAPLKGLTVRLIDKKIKGAKAFTVTTDAEGYFSIDLGTDKPTPGDSGAKPHPINLAKWVADWMAGTSQDTDAAPATDTEAGVGQVEILKANGKLLHRDPTLVALNEGSVYREYVIAAIELSPEQAAKKSSRRAKTVRSKNRK